MNSDMSKRIKRRTRVVGLFPNESSLLRPEFHKKARHLLMAGLFLE